MLVEALAQLSRISETRLMLIASTASARYKTFEIPKRSGGTRTIHHPSRELKAIQRWLTRAVIHRLPVHPSATAYQRSSSVRSNAARHQFTKYTTRYDFSDFFPSFEQTNIKNFLIGEREKLPLNVSDGDIEFFCQIVCRNGRLTIGAPSSPSLTNAMMYSFDVSMENICKERDLIYTRYADDIFVSSFAAHQMADLIELITKAANNIDYLNLSLNGSKTTYLSRKNVRRVTGVVITPEEELSIGRDRKREIRTLIYLWKNGKLDPERISYLRGLLAFAFDIEPSLEGRLRTKFGNEAIFRLVRNVLSDDTPTESGGDGLI